MGTKRCKSGKLFLHLSSNVFYKVKATMHEFREHSLHLPKIIYGKKERRKITGKYRFKTLQNQEDVSNIEVVGLARVADLPTNKV